jgi:hypothetical protein
MTERFEADNNICKIFKDIYIYMQLNNGKYSNYNYEMFLNNLENGCINVLNGGFNLESSLLSLKKFNHSHRFYYFNCQNLEKVENVSQSVELKGANNSNVVIDLSIFIIYNRKVVISKTNGQILELTK